MATTAFLPNPVLFVCSASTIYSVAREGTGTEVFENQYPWVGQYLGGGRHEVNQVFAQFDLSSIPVDATITGAVMRVTLGESYGTFAMEVRSSAVLGPFIPGSELGSRTQLGSYLVTGAFVGTTNIPLSNVTRANLERVVFASAPQRTGTPTTNDDTARLDSVELEVTFTPRASNKSLVVTATGAGTWTPTFTGWVYGEVWGGGGVSRTARGGGGAYSAGWFPVTAGVPVAYYVAERQFGGLQNGNYPNIVGQDSWVESQTTILAKGANVVTGGQAAAGFGEVRFSGGSGVSQGGGASASPYGNGENGSYPTLGGSTYEAGGSSPQAGVGALYPDQGGPLGRFAESHVDGGGGGSDYDQYGVPGEPGGGAGEQLTFGDRLTSRGQARFSWYEADPPNGSGTVSLGSPRVQSTSTFTQPARQGAGTISLARKVAATVVSVVPINAVAGVSLRSPLPSGLSNFTNPPSGAGVTGVTGWKTPGSLQSLVDGNRSWTPLTPANLASVDGTIVRATGINSTAITHVLRSNNFGFSTSDIPAGATITGVEVEIVRRRSFGSGVPNARHARLSLNDTGGLGDQIGTNNSTDVEWTNSFTTAPYGGAADMWGVALTPELIKNPNFGFDYGLQGTAASMDAAIDQLRMRVHYTAPGGLWAIGVVSLKGPSTSASAGQNIQALATVSLTAPKAELQSFHGPSFSGAIQLGSPSVQGSGSHTRVGSGVVTLTSPAVSASSAHGVEGSSAISLPSPATSATGSYTRVGSGVVNLTAPVASADGQHKVGAQGLVTLGSPSAIAYANRGALSSSTITLTAPAASGTVSHATGASAAIVMSNPSTDGQAGHGVDASGSVFLTVPIAAADAQHSIAASSAASLPAPAVVVDADHGVAGDGAISISAPKADAQGSQITGAYSAIRFAPTVDGSSVHGVAASLAIPLAQPSVTASGSLQPQGVGQIVLGASKVAGVMSQGGFARVTLKGPSVDALGGHGTSVHGIVTLTAPSASGGAAAGATGQGNADLVSPGVNALAKRGTASSAAIPLAMRVMGDLVHSIAAGGIVSLTVSTNGLADHGVAGEGAISLTAPAVTGSLEPGLVHGSGMVSLGGVAVDGSIFIDLSTIYAQGAVMLGSPSAKGRALTLPTHGQRTVLIAGEQRVVAPPNEPRSLNIGNELRVITVAPE
ncbi:hypothetical protein [Brevundimonas sp.]|uniref:hypothetical protein n=1 Tax=Brevundimonas sp. TaxID=1871086 RepID=UPI002896ACD4|nr:hypothetical protein [Brevundimonas sp.]